MVVVLYTFVFSGKTCSLPAITCCPLALGSHRAAAAGCWHWSLHYPSIVVGIVHSVRGDNTTSRVASDSVNQAIDNSYSEAVTQCWQGGAVGSTSPWSFLVCRNGYVCESAYGENPVTNHTGCEIFPSRGHGRLCDPGVCKRAIATVGIFKELLSAGLALRQSPAALATAWRRA